MMISVFVGVENIIGKGENDGYQHSLLSPIFLKRIFSLDVQTYCSDISYDYNEYLQ